MSWILLKNNLQTFAVQVSAVQFRFSAVQFRSPKFDNEHLTVS